MPPCNCHPPFPRPEPFSPLPRPGKTPDWGKWIRDRLSEKGALLVFPTRASFPNPGAWPNLYLDLETGAVYRWSGTQYTEIAKIITPSTSAPLVDGTASAGSSEAYSRGDHRHPTDTTRASVADATLTPIYSDTPTFSEWVCDPATITYSGGTIELSVSSMPSDNPVRDILHPKNSPPSIEIASLDYSPTALSRTFALPSAFNVSTVTATRTRTDIIGYTLGSQTNKQVAAAEPLLLARYYPEGNVKSAAEFTEGIKYNFDTTNHTATVKPFCNTGDSEHDNSGLVGRVVIPPFVDGNGNGYISDDGTRFKVVGVSDGSPDGGSSVGQIAIIAPSTVTTIGNCAFDSCTSLATVSLPAATTIGGHDAFSNCTVLASVSLPAATTIGNAAFNYCTALTSVSLPAATTVGNSAFYNCTRLASVDFGDTPRSEVPTLGANAFGGVTTSCKIIVPDAQYDAWTAETIPDPEHEGETIPNPWYALVTAGYKFLKHSEWEYARKYEVDAKLDNTAVSESLLDIPLGNYADMESIADRLDSVVRALKGIYGPDDRTLYFRSLQDGSTVTMQKVGSAPDVSLEYSVDDGVNWSSFVVGETTITINRGKWVRIRATSDATQTRFATSTSVYNKFSLGGSIAVGGNSMSLFYHEYADIAAATAFPDASKSNILASLFLGNVALKDASSLILPATTLASDCYSSMFSGCTSLAEAPELPATTLASYCYGSMFERCTSLTVAPELPATTLAPGCYGSMFSGCTSLTVAPELPATTLASSCYGGMFNSCTSLAAAPELPATTLVSGCYGRMFNSCTSLAAAPELPATTLASSCYYSMFSGCTSLTTVSADFGAWSPSNATSTWLGGVAATGEFHCKPGLDTSTTGSSKVPSGWTVFKDR